MNVGDEPELVRLLAAHDLAEDLAARLAAFGARLLEANRRTNLTGAKTAQALAAHLLDALTLRDAVASPLVDVGSGGGLPGIPLALATGAEVLLVESVVKKAKFLEEALAALGIGGEVAAERAETVARDPRHRGRYASATARAVGSAPTVAELTVPFLQLGGRALLQRGRLEPGERRALEDAALVLGAQLTGERVLDGERRLLVLEKTKSTAGAFPRRPGVPAKRPLCWPGGDVSR